MVRSSVTEMLAHLVKFTRFFTPIWLVLIGHVM